MKTGAIICFVLSALAANYVLDLLRAIVLVRAAGPTPDISLDIFLPRLVGMLLVPIALLILGLFLWKKGEGRITPPPLPGSR